MQLTLDGKTRFTEGLDVGCGTGRSAVALADFCDHVHAMDPSPSMLAAAIQHPSISYAQGSAERIPLQDRSVDVITYAGSLSYADAKLTAIEMERVSRKGTLIVTYDFDVRLDRVLQSLGIETRGDSDYDHAVNFAGEPTLETIRVCRQAMTLQAKADDVAHLLLADAERHDQFVDRYQADTPLADLVRELGAITVHQSLDVDIYYTLHRRCG